MACRLLCLSIACAALPLAAQEPTRDPHAVQPERPTVATHAHTVAPGWLEFELGGEYDRYDDATHGVLTPLTTKLGLTSHAQLTIQAGLNAPPGGGSLGVGDLSMGVKWRLADDVPILGDVAILPSVKFPTGSDASGRGTGTTDVSLLLISSNDLGAISLDINAGYTRRSGDGSNAPRDAALWTVSLGGPALDWMGWTLECYGYPATTGPAGQANIVALLGGPTFSLTPWLAADAGGIVPVTGPQPKALYAGMVVNVGQVFR